MNVRERISDKPLGSYKPPPRVPLHILSGWISAVIDQLHAYAARGIREELTLAAWADGYSIEQVEARAKEMEAQG